MPDQGILVIAGQFPPPIHGFSYITQEMARLLSARARAVMIDLTPRDGKGKVSYHLRRLALALRAAGTILKQGTQSPRPRVYLACEGGYGVVYTLLLAMAARCVGAPVYAHHHSFYYIDRAFPLMALLLKVLGRSATHIFLSQGMAQRFADRYGRRVMGVVLSNSAFVEPQAQPEPREGRPPPLTIGLLSNLNEEKGLSLFIETLRMAKTKGLGVKGVLAGPVKLERDRQTIERARRELGDLLDCRGPLYGDEKQSFYRQIDVFVFPTTYLNEAQPTVIFEAMSHGVPVLSFDRGCIREQVQTAGAVAEQGADFPSFAVARIAQWLADPHFFESLRLDTARLFQEDRRKALDVAENLLSRSPPTIEPSHDDRQRRN